MIKNHGKEDLSPPLVYLVHFDTEWKHVMFPFEGQIRRSSELSGKSAELRKLPGEPLISATSVTAREGGQGPRDVSSFPSRAPDLSAVGIFRVYISMALDRQL